MDETPGMLATLPNIDHLFYMQASARAQIEAFDWGAALTTYQGLLGQLLDLYLDNDDADEHLLEMARAALEGIAESFAFVTPHRREEGLRSLLSAFAWDLRAGGLGLTCAVTGALRQVEMTPTDRLALGEFVERHQSPRPRAWALEELTELAKN